MKKNRGNRILFSLFMVFFGVLLRLIINKTLSIPNFEPVTSLSLVAGSLLGGLLGLNVPLFIVFLSDIVFKNSSVFIFTWSAFLLISLAGSFVKKNNKYYHLKITGLALLSVLFFYLWTNFGWWLTSNMYAMDYKGLINCYLAAIPFLKNQLFSAILFTPCFSIIFSYLYEALSLKEQGLYRSRPQKN